IAAAAFAFEIRFGRQASEFERLADMLIYGLMNVVHFFLRFEEATGNRITQDGFAFLFKRRDFLAGQLLGALLLLLQGLAFGHESLVLGPGFVVCDEFFNSLTGGTHLRLVQN